MIVINALRPPPAMPAKRQHAIAPSQKAVRRPPTRAVVLDCLAGIGAPSVLTSSISFGRYVSRYFTLTASGGTEVPSMIAWSGQ